MQFQKLTDQLSLLVFQAIGKYIHPTRYTQIIETESVSKLDLEEQRFVSEDQKHSLNVARVHYQKFRSQHAGLHCSCMEKLRGDNGKAMDMRVKELRETNSNATETGQAIASSPRNAITTRASIQRNNINIPSTVKGPIRFTQEEDNYLRKGIEKFGIRWVLAILKCPLYKFE